MSVNQDEWDQNQLRLGASFLQSSKWAEFQESVGFKPHFLSGPGWSCLALEKTNRFGKYLFAPLGPTLQSVASFDDCLDQLVQLAKSIGADWLKLEPVSAEDLGALTHKLQARGAVRAAHDVEPALTRYLDLEPSLEAILGGVSQSTRSLIRKNQRENFLSFQTSTNPADMPVFVRMLETVATRKRVGFFSEAYFAQQAKNLMPAGLMRLELALDGKQPVAATVIHDFGTAGSYTYAASLPQARQTSASALLLWQAIANAKARGITIFDLFGIAPDDAPHSHPWHSFSTFKKKFGGRVVERAGTWDMPISNKYRLYRAAQRLQRGLKRR
jgi:lipid II:glycine glycyltransferase (peptidoglycan interpeptide bridge formation enzyme)